MSATKTKYKAGEYLFREGEPSKSMFLIKKGTVAIRKRKGGAFVELGKLYANAPLGEISFFDRQPRSASALAITDVEALELTFESLDKVYSNVPDYLKTILAAVAERLRKANETIRRLQKQVVTDEEGVEIGDTGGEGAEDTKAILEATADIGVDVDLPEDPDSDKDNV